MDSFVFESENLYSYAVADGKKEKRKKLWLLLSGAAIGAVNGVFGAGGGMLAVPVLTFVAGLPEKKAHATAIAVILPLCLVCTIIYFLSGSYDYGVFAPTVSGVVVGSVLGAAALKKINNVALKFVFYGLMLFAGLKMMI